MNAGLLSSSISRMAGGLFYAVCGIARGLAERNLEVNVFALADEYSGEDLPLWHPVTPRLLQVTGPRSFGYAPRLIGCLENATLDLLHLHGLWMYPSVAALAWHRRSRRPCVVSAHGMLDSWALAHSRWKKRLAGWLFENGNLRKAACLHALCESEAQSIRAYGLKNPIAVIPNGIDLPEMQNAKCRMQNSAWHGQIEPGRKVLLYLSRIHPKKGLGNLIRAWAQVCRPQSPCFRPPSSDWILAIAGWDQGGHEAELKRLATELGIAWADVREHGVGSGERTADLSVSAFQHFSVFFLGPLFGPAKDAAYRVCDAFILPSFSEGLPMAVLEAWAYGKPVLMTPQCNLPEGFAAGAAIRIEHGEGSGQRGAGSIEQGLRELFQAPSSRLQALGANGRQLVAEEFTWPKIAADMKSVYDWVLGGGPRPASVILT